MTRAPSLGHRPACTPVQLPDCSYRKYESSLLAASSSFVPIFPHMDGLAYAHRMTFGKRLADRRKEKELTQTDLGRGLGTDGADVSKAVVYGWEKDQHHPRVDQLALICKRLNCSSDYLLFGIDASTQLSTEVASIAVDLDQLKDTARSYALRMCREVISFAKNGGNPVTQNAETKKKQA